MSTGKEANGWQPKLPYPWWVCSATAALQQEWFLP